MATKVIILGVNLVNPWVYFNPIAQTISSKPAINKINQAIIPPNN